MSYSLSKRNHVVKLVLIDLLVRNRGVSRGSTQNYFEEKIYKV